MLTHLVHLFSHSHSSIEKSIARSHNKRKSSRDSGSVHGSHLSRDKILSGQRDLHNFFEKKADQAFQGDCAAQTKLSEAQSELDRREWRMQNVDRALFETSMPLYQANQLTDQSQKGNWLCTELEVRGSAFQEDRARICQEIEELRMMCCTEGRARQLRIELSTQEEESESTVNQLMVEIQELQDKDTSLNDAREFYDLETVSSSWLSHVPSQLVSIPSPRGLISFAMVLRNMYCSRKDGYHLLRIMGSRVSSRAKVHEWQRVAWIGGFDGDEWRRLEGTDMASPLRVACDRLFRIFPLRSVEAILKVVDWMCRDISQLYSGDVLSFSSCIFLLCHPDRHTVR